MTAEQDRYSMVRGGKTYWQASGLGQGCMSTERGPECQCPGRETTSDVAVQLALSGHGVSQVAF